MDRRSFLGFIAILPIAGKLIGKTLGKEKPSEREHEVAQLYVKHEPFLPTRLAVGDTFYHEATKTMAEVVMIQSESPWVEMRSIPYPTGLMTFNMRQDDILSGAYIYMGNHISGMFGRDAHERH